MALRDIFKKKQPAVPKKKEDKKKEEKKEVKIPKRETVQAIPAKKKVVENEIAFRVLKEPHITEKATDLAAQENYVFKIYPKVNKNQIKEAIEELYNVDVVGVRTIKIPKKRRMVKGKVGWRKGYKKAVIQIKKGQKIEVMPK